MSKPARFGTVTQVAPLRILIDGDADPVDADPVALTSPLVVGDRVACEVRDKQLVVYGSVSAPARNIYMRNAARLMTGGGNRKAPDANTISWSTRFLLGMGAGRSTSTALSGYFNVEQPPSGQVIPVLGDTRGTATTVTSSGIPLVNWQILWYDPPVGGGEVSDPSRFYITSYGMNFAPVPPTWVPLVTKNGDSGTFYWFDGQETAAWIYPTLTSGWSNYGSGYTSARYKKQNGVVYAQGLIKGGTLGSTATVWQFPVGMRPDSTLQWTGAAASGVADIRCFSNGALTVYALYTGANNASVSLAQVSFTPDQ